MENTVTLSLRLCLLLSTITSLPTLLLAQEGTSEGGIHFSFSSDSEPLIGWSEIISGNEAPIEDWLPQSILPSNQRTHSRSGILQVDFHDELPNLPEPVRIVPATPTTQPKIIRVPANPIAGEPEINPATGNGDVSDTDQAPTTASISLVTTAKTLTEPPSPVLTTEVKQETESKTASQSATWEPRSAPLIDPNLCGSDSYRITDNTLESDLMPHRCGHCESCVQNNQRSAGLANLRSRIRLSRERFRKTLLGDASLFNERPFGGSLNAVLHAQTIQGAKSRCSVWEFDFDRNPDGSPTAKIKPTTIPRLQLIAELMVDTGHTLRLQSSGNSSLDQRRATAIVAQLSTLGVSIPDSAIEISNSRTHEQSGIESDIQFRSRITQGVSGNSGASAPSGSTSLPSSN